MKLFSFKSAKTPEEKEKILSDAQMVRDDLLKALNEDIGVALLEREEFEHAYHSGMAERQIELAKLDALIEAKRAMLTEQLQAKDSIIETLHMTIIQLAKGNCACGKN
jgi:hypothetical protein